jgi:hypothetical protein
MVSLGECRYNGRFRTRPRLFVTSLEKCSEGVITWDQLRAVSACLSCLHALMTGESGTNWEEVQEVWDSLQCEKPVIIIFLISLFEPLQTLNPTTKCTASRSADELTTPC